MSYPDNIDSEEQFFNSEVELENESENKDEQLKKNISLVRLFFVQMIWKIFGHQLFKFKGFP